MSHLGPDRKQEFFDAVKKGAHAQVQMMLRAEPGLASAFDPPCFGATPLVHAACAGDRQMIDILLDAGVDPNQRNDWWAGGFGPLDDCSAEVAEYLVHRGATLTPHAAARLGWMTELRQILESSPEAVRQRGGDGQFPLHFSRSPEVAELLLAHGAEIDALDLDHESTAAQWSLPERQEVAAYLVQRGAQRDPFMAAMIGDLPGLQHLLRSDPEGAGARITRTRFANSTRAAGHIYLFTIGENCTLMHAAASANRAEIIRWLASQGQQVNARGGYDDQTPLHAAAWRDCPEAAAALLDCGADINACSGKLHDNEPVGWAIVAGSVQVVRLLMERGSTVRPAHVRDAECGVTGQWRCLKRHRKLEDWAQVLRMIRAGVE